MPFYLKLVRFPNLLLIIATQCIMRWFVIQPILKWSIIQQLHGVFVFKLQMRELDFFILVLSTVCIAAAGYVINDYFDIKTDLMNRPDEIIVGKIISRRKAMLLHSILNISGILCGIYVSFRIGRPIFSIIFIFITGLLWFYSTTYKSQFLVGNIIVALLTGLVPLIIVIFEVPMLYNAYSDTLHYLKTDLNSILAWVGGFSIFSFLINLIREIIKDTEDLEGDTTTGGNTLPIILGIKYTKLIIYTLILITILLMIYVYLNFLSPPGYTDYISLIYISLFLVMPFIYLSWRVYLSKSKDDYHSASTLSKIIMLAGLGYAFIFNFILWRIGNVN